MNVPLDRLYDFLQGVSNLDILIYRFYPHGSKNLNDLLPLRDHNFFEKLTKIILICNDQEPLNQDIYKDAVINDIPIFVTSGWHEATELRKTFYPGFKSAIAASGINLNDYCILLHSEKNSEQVKLYEQQQYICVYYWSHAIIAKDWFRYAEIDPCIKTKTKWPEKNFLIYNRAWSGTREYRLKFSELLIDNNLIPCCQIKFNPVDGIHYSLHNFKNSSFQTLRTDLESKIPTNTADSSASADYVSSDYQNTAIEVVLETLFDDQRHHLTEKILRPIACCQPFILAATAGSLQYLRDYGFKTFAPYIDETYDTIQDPLIRLEAIIAEMKKISKLSQGQKNLLNQQLMEIAEYNKKRFFSAEFLQTVVKEYQENLAHAVGILKPQRKGKNWKSMKKFLYTKYGSRAVRNTLCKETVFDKDLSVRLRNWIRNPPDI